MLGKLYTTELHPFLEGILSEKSAQAFKVSIISRLKAVKGS